MNQITDFKNETKKGVKKMIEQNGIKTEINIDGIDVEFERMTIWSHDPNYGADADGNRGVPCDFLDEDYADDVTVLGIPIELYPIPFRKLVMREINAWLEDNEPDMPEAEQYEGGDE
jgi:hypothetical protein